MIFGEGSLGLALVAQRSGVCSSVAGAVSLTDPCSGNEGPTCRLE